MFGLILVPLVDHFDSDRGTVSWVGSLLCGVYMLVGPIVGGLVNKFGCRYLLTCVNTRTEYGVIIGPVTFY